MGNGWITVDLVEEKVGRLARPAFFCSGTGRRDSNTRGLAGAEGAGGDTLRDSTPKAPAKQHPVGLVRLKPERPEAYASGLSFSLPWKRPFWPELVSIGSVGSPSRTADWRVKTTPTPCFDPFSAFTKPRPGGMLSRVGSGTVSECERTGETGRTDASSGRQN